MALNSWSSAPIKYSITVPAHAQEDWRITISVTTGTTPTNNTDIIGEIGENWAKMALEANGSGVEITAEIDADTWLLGAATVGTPSTVFDLGSSDDGYAGLSVYGDPQDNAAGDALVFDGNDGLYLSTDLGNSSDEVFIVIVKIADKNGGIQAFCKDGGYGNGVAAGIDASGNLGIFGILGYTKTSITIPPADYSNGVWYRIYFTRTRVTITALATGDIIATASGVCNAGDGGAAWSVGYVTSQSPISGATGGNIEFVAAGTEIALVEVYAVADLIAPSPASGDIYLPASLLSASGPIKLTLYADGSAADNPNITDVVTPPASYWDAADLVTWFKIFKYEQDYSFFARSLTEQFYSYRTIPAPLAQAVYNFQIRDAIKYESDYPFDLERAKQFETDYRFDLIAYKLYQALYDFKIKAGQTFTEVDYLFKVLFRNNELYEQQYSLWLNGLIDNFSVQAGLSVVVDGVHLKCLSIAGGRNGYYNLYRVVVPDDQRFQSLGLGGEATLTWHSARLQGDTVVPVIDKQIPLIYKQASVSASASDQGDVRTGTLDLVSKTAQLDRLPAPLLGSAPVSAIWQKGTLASEVLDALCLPYLPYTLEYGDYPLLQDLDGGGRYPIEIINELYPLADIGPDVDGHLLIRPKMSRSWDELSAPGFDDYDLVLPESEYAIDIQQDYPTTPLYNAVTVRNVAESDSVIFPAPTIVQDEDDPSKATVYGYRYPWERFELITCNTECGNVQIPGGSEEIIEVTESLDFEGGKASFSLPVHEFVSVDWGCNHSLGTITASGDGSLQAAVSQWSYGDVTCKVRRMVFRITAYNGRPDDLKFRLRDV